MVFVLCFCQGWTRIGVLGRNTTKIMCHFHDISRVHMINSYHWWQPGSCGCRRNYQVKLLNTPCQNIAPLPIPYLLEGNDSIQPIYLRSEALCSTSMRAEYLHKLWFFCMGNFSILFCLLIKPSFISVWTHGYLLYILGSNTIVLYFVAQIVLDLVTGISFSWLLCPFDTPPSWFLSFLSTLLLRDTKRWSRFILYISCPIPRISCFSKECSN